MKRVRYFIWGLGLISAAGLVWAAESSETYNDEDNSYYHPSENQSEQHYRSERNKSSNPYERNKYSDPYKQDQSQYKQNPSQQESNQPGMRKEADQSSSEKQYQGGSEKQGSKQNQGETGVMSELSRVFGSTQNNASNSPNSTRSMPLKDAAQARRQAYFNDSRQADKFGGAGSKESSMAMSGPIRWSEPTEGRVIRPPNIYGYEEPGSTNMTSPNATDGNESGATDNEKRESSCGCPCKERKTACDCPYKEKCERRENCEHREKCERRGKCERQANAYNPCYGYTGTDKADKNECPKARTEKQDGCKARKETRCEERQNCDFGRTTSLFSKSVLKDQDDYYYTRYWAVDQPPVQVHSRFQTIYDSPTTDNYYSPWIGSNVVWTPNAMVVAPMPRPSGQWRRLGNHQLVTTFTPWRDGNVSERPEPFALIRWRRSGEGTASGAESGQLDLNATMPNASEASPNIYGYRAGDASAPIAKGKAAHKNAYYMASTSAAPTNPAQEGDNNYWDDRDLMEAPATTGAPNYGYVAPAPAATGYVKPNIDGSFNPGTAFRDQDGQIFEAKPDSQDEINYGHSDGRSE